MKRKTWIKSVTACAIIAALVPLNMGGCSSDPIGSVGDFAGMATGHGGGSKEADYVGAGLKATSALTMNEKDEQDMGKAVAIAVTSQYGVYNNVTATDYVTKVGLTVAAFSSRSDYNYMFCILDTDDINAFSGPAGYIMITRGALAQMQDESELAGVLAHEVAHVAKRHGFEMVKNAKLLSAGAQAGAAGTVAAQTDLTDKVIDVIMKTGYSQAQENDADATAVKILITTGYDPNGYLHYLQRLAAEKGSKGSIMSTHPGLGDRATKVQAKINEKGNPGGATLKERFAQNVVLTKPQ